MQDEDRIERCRDRAISALCELRIVVCQLPTGFLQSSALFSGGKDFPVNDGKSTSLQRDIEVDGKSRGGGAGRSCCTVPPTGELFPCLGEGDSAPEHLGGVVEEVLFVLEAQLHDR